MRHITSAMLFLALAPDAWAIETASVFERVALVGVIAESSTTNAGVAVLKDKVSQRSFAVKVGDALPGVPNIIVKNVARKGVVISDGIRELAVTHEEAAQAEASAEQPPADTSSASGEVIPARSESLLEGAEVRLSGDDAKAAAEFWEAFYRRLQEEEENTLDEAYDKWAELDREAAHEPREEVKRDEVNEPASDQPIRILKQARRQRNAVPSVERAEPQVEAAVPEEGNEVAE